ncbi:probable kex2-endoproteinase of late golgi compartment [Ceraceosorus bombacis]|uniref:Probable kex2-endoproteinase of late golgi compartment n=1 Tax=Ceraceosorus bombacis TaxID=401625 RepID=A0A0P1BHH1_9BASI|nr:probable kex2-endoproteinase of late golgi compartment [Ceraceosorus bombacis]
MSRPSASKGTRSQQGALLFLCVLAAILAFSSSPSQASDNASAVSFAAIHRRATIGGAPAYDLPMPRSYDTHHYYAVQIKRTHSNHVDIRDVSEALGVEFVERVGELKDHWLVRAEKPLDPSSLTLAARDTDPRSSGEVKIKRRDWSEDEDPVISRWRSYKRSPRQNSAILSKREAHLLGSIVDVERQVLKKRHKRDKIISPWDTPEHYPEVRAPIPGPEPQPYPDPMPLPIPDGSNLKSTRMRQQFNIADPIFTDQWHLTNDKRDSNDLNVTGIWAQGIHGKGSNVCLIDDGLDFNSPDLKDNFFEAGSYDFNTHTPLPKPLHSDDQHGTRCAGEIAAIKNDACGVGVAWDAKVAGVRILSGPISDVDEAAALNYRYQENQIYSCSWGPPDDGRAMDAPRGLIAKAVLNGIQNGRGGKGSIFVFAGGNGGASDDQCNFDGYTNSIYTMTIAAVDRENQHPYYSEMCASNIATGWSSGSGDHIHTTDVAWNGVNRCTTHHGGTSAAAPLVAGVIALALQVRPELTWRDMQHIAVHSAQMVNPDDKDWQVTQAGRHYNHKYGYGIIDAFKFVEEAKTHTLVKPQAWAESPNVTLARDNTLITGDGTHSTFTVTKEFLEKNNVDTLEHVTIRVWISHERRGDVDVELVSPHGTKSVLARPRRYDDATTGFPGWGFMTLKHWDEDPIGDWTMTVYDRAHPKQTGNFWAWTITLWGQVIDPAKAKAWNFPEDSIEFHETLEAAPTTTTVYQPGGAASQRPKPTDHLPPDHGSRPGESDHDFTNSGPGQSSPEADTGYLAGLKNRSSWLFIAGGVVLIFAGSLAAFFIIRRRRQRRFGPDAAAAYEFVPGEEDEEMAMSAMGGSAGATGGRGGRRARAKELYDAFGEATDDEDEGEEDALVKRGARPGQYKDEPDTPTVREHKEGEEDSRFAISDETQTPLTAETPARGRGQATSPAPVLRSQEMDKGRSEQLLFDAEDDDEERGEEGSGGSGGSWQDASRP